MDRREHGVRICHNFTWWFYAFHCGYARTEPSPSLFGNGGTTALKCTYFSGALNKQLGVDIYLLIAARSHSYWITNNFVRMSICYIIGP